MPLTTSNGNYGFPSFLMDRIKIEVKGERGYVWPTNGQPLYGYYDPNCFPNLDSWCPRNTTFTIGVPNEGNFTINIIAKTGTCTQANINTGCSSKTGQAVGALQKFTWKKEILAGVVSSGSIIQLDGDPYLNATGYLQIENKCCCNSLNDYQMCGVQPDQTKYNTCVPFTFVENTYLYSGVCGANGADSYFCKNPDDIIEPIDNNCGTRCNAYTPCTDPGYSCSSSTNSDGICQKPCSSTANCPPGQGCNTGWCR